MYYVNKICTREKTCILAIQCILEHLQPFEAPGSKFGDIFAGLDVKRTWVA
jgi:hypothetical protein